ncbi:MAG: hypothetical protein FWD05_13770 [Oscillospiraceae bacterium]|nr:hypothetical protein [Oscillospiraceae bacterium]
MSTQENKRRGSRIFSGFAGAALTAIAMLAVPFFNGPSLFHNNSDELSYQDIEQQLEEAFSAGHAQGLLDGENASALLLREEYNRGFNDGVNSIVDSEVFIEPEYGDIDSLEYTPPQQNQRISLYRGAPAFDNYPSGTPGTARFMAHADTAMMGGISFRDVLISSRVSSGTNFTLHTLGGQFNVLSGYIGRIDGSDMIDATVIFFGDGEYLDTVRVNAIDEPIHFSLDVQGVTRLQIKTEFPRRGSYAIQGFVE